MDLMRKRILETGVSYGERSITSGSVVGSERSGAVLGSVAAGCREGQ